MIIEKEIRCNNEKWKEDRREEYFIWTSEKKGKKEKNKDS